MIIRKYANNVKKKSFAAAIFFRIFEEVGEQFFCKPPILPVYAVSDFRGFYFALYKTRVFQFFKMLGNGGFCDGEFVVYVAEKAGVERGEIFQNGNSGGVSQRAGEFCNQNCFVFVICATFCHFENIILNEIVRQIIIFG